MVNIYFKNKVVTRSLGRNGLMKTIGVSTIKTDDDTISISPINSKDLAGRCSIELPVETLLRLAKKIKKGKL
jgi:hypothetical protein